MIRNRLIVVFVIFMILSTTLVIIIPIGSKGAQPVGSICLDTTEETAHVGPGEDGIVTFTGTVEVDLTGPGKNFQTVIATLEVGSTWPASITPTTMHFTAQETGMVKPFEVTIKVPNFTSTSMNEQFVVSGSVRASPGPPVSYRMSPATGLITIAPYAILSLSCEDPYKNIGQGNMASYLLRVRNNGNGVGKITAELNDIDEMINDGWAIYDTKYDLYVDVHKEDILNITLSVPASARVAAYKFDISVLLDVGGEIDSQEYRFFVNVTVKKKNGVVLD